jgi:hypothetical protein
MQPIRSDRTNSTFVETVNGGRKVRRVAVQ